MTRARRAARSILDLERLAERMADEWHTKGKFRFDDAGDFALRVARTVARACARVAGQGRIMGDDEPSTDVLNEYADNNAGELRLAGRKDAEHAIRRAARRPVRRT